MSANNIRRVIIMASTVNKAFDEFMKNIVNLDKDVTNKARKSRDNLINNICKFDGDSDFFAVYDEKNMKFGSFGRNTKIRELDDIDLLICLSAEGSRTYFEGLDRRIYIYGNDNDVKNKLVHEGTNLLNSTKVINRFISKLAVLYDYRSAEMHKNMEAVTLKMNSYAWNFDIVPCFYTTGDFYLIPDGKGYWKKTDPRIDQNSLSFVNQKHNGNFLNLVRLVKYFNRRNSASAIGSYLLETMLINIYENKNIFLPWSIKEQFMEVLYALSEDIYYNVYDRKSMQGNLNNYSCNEREKISANFYQAYLKAFDAINFEKTGEQEKAIIKWCEILGPAFPEYTIK